MQWDEHLEQIKIPSACIHIYIIIMYLKYYYFPSHTRAALSNPLLIFLMRTVWYFGAIGVNNQRSRELTWTEHTGQSLLRTILLGLMDLPLTEPVCCFFYFLIFSYIFSYFLIFSHIFLFSHMFIFSYVFLYLLMYSYIVIHSSIISCVPLISPDISSKSLLAVTIIRPSYCLRYNWKEIFHWLLWHL